MVNAAAFAARHGHADRVRAYLTNAYVADGRLARLDLPAALELERDAAVSDAATAIMANLGPTAVDRAAYLLVWAGDADAATELLTKDAPNGDQIMAMAVRAAKREPGASDRLRELVMSSPDERAVRWAWLAAIESCDAPAWLRWSRSYVILTGVNLRVPKHVDVVPVTRTDHQPSRYPRVIWGIGPVSPGDVTGTVTWDVDGGYPCGP